MWGSWWFGGKTLAALMCASLMHRAMPCGLGLDGHHSSYLLAFLKTEKICVSMVQKLREWNSPARRVWARRLVPEWPMRCGSLGRGGQPKPGRRGQHRRQRVKPGLRVEQPISVWLEKAAAAHVAGWRPSSRFQFDLGPRAKTVMWSCFLTRSWMALAHHFRSSL